MCKFENQFILCTCNTNFSNLITWKLLRKTERKTTSSYKIIGQINIPKEFENITSEEYDSKIDEMILFGKLHKKRKTELGNVILNIKNELNQRYCFDKNIDFIDNDILSIRIDTDFNIWVNYIYNKSKWEIHESHLDYDYYSEI